MLQTTTDQTPAALADVLGDLLASTQDREIAAILATARESLRALAWNRYAQRMTRQSAHRAFTARHKSLKGATNA
jgi:hypothetical protein